MEGPRTHLPGTGSLLCLNIRGVRLQGGLLGGFRIVDVPEALLATAVCRAEVLVECDGSVGDSFYLSSGYLKSFGNGYAATQPSAFQPVDVPSQGHTLVVQQTGSFSGGLSEGDTCPPVGAQMSWPYSQP